MPWRTQYADKVRTAAAAIQRIRSGQHVFIGSGCAEPQSLVAALTARGDELSDLEVLHILTLGIAPYTAARFEDTFRHNAFYVGPNVRDAVADGRADYTPVFLSELPGLLAHGRIPVDVALIQVAPPDRDGRCSLGISVDVVQAAATHADLVIAEVNTHMPRTRGDTTMAAEEIGLFVPTDAPLLTLAPGPPNETARRIGAHVATLVEDGATLQLGTGPIAEAIAGALGDKRDLGIHTETFTDSLRKLMEAGVVTNARKTLHRGAAIASRAMGSATLYAFVDDNPACEFHPTDHVNDPFIIAQNARMVAVCGALEVDLTGQVRADATGPDFSGGLGGRLDFLRGAARATGGVPIVALPSASADGARSHIVGTLAGGADIVATPGDVHYVVTEWGVADLHGKTRRERALALIGVAHPHARPALLDAAKTRRLVYADQLPPPESGGVYPDAWETTCTIKNGATVHVRPIRPTDEEGMRDLFYACSDRSIYRRFMSPMKAMPHWRLQRFTNCDYRTTVALVATRRWDDREELVAVARYGVEGDEGLADAAFLVRDDWQNLGLGRFLMARLVEIARHNGLAGLTADVLGENAPMLHLLHTSGVRPETHVAAGICHVTLRFGEPPAHAP